MPKYDFTGWATKVNVKCSDGRIIMKDAFKHNDGKKVPLVWDHQHHDLEHIIGYAILEHRDEGVYAHCAFNDTKNGELAKVLVRHGDLDQLSIYANQLKEQLPYVQHGNIRELSLVSAGANPQAYIDHVIAHSDDGESVVNEQEAIIYTTERIELCHADEPEEPKKEDSPAEEPKKDPEPEKEKTVEEIYNAMTEEQKIAVCAIVGQAVEDASGKDDDEDKETDNSEGGNNTMKQNAFDQETKKDEGVIAHSDLVAVIDEAKRTGGSMKEVALAHGIDQMQLLFPEEHALNNVPTFLGDFGWVKEIMNGVHKSPFSKIRALFANISGEEARAKGYLKGKKKKEEVFALLKRTTSPQTVYKLQKMDRDDIIDIRDMDVVAFIKAEMRIKLEEEIARAILIGDGRLPDAEEKIKEEHIRPIWTDEELYSIHSLVDVKADAKMADIAAEFIDQAVRAREDYDGSGSPKAYMAENLLAACLLLKDATGRRLYKDVNELATAMMVSKIVTVPAMKGASRTDSDGKTRNLLGIIVNLSDYTVGADKGGAVAMFDDFDIDFNRYTYLIETRCSGSLMKPKSGIVLEMFASEAAAG